MRKTLIFFVFLFCLVNLSGDCQAQGLPQVVRRGRVVPLARVRAAVRAFLNPRRGVAPRQFVAPRRQFVNPRRGFVRGRRF